MPLLGVNIDHVATLRQARRALEPSPVDAAVLAELAGADGITAHLREDRRHMNELDIERLRGTVHTKLNLEMSIAKDIVDIACKIKPDQATLVPEKREELTTEGGLDVVAYYAQIKAVVSKLGTNGICTSLFIDPDRIQIKAAKKIGAGLIELHTGRYANAKNSIDIKRELDALLHGFKFARDIGLRVNAGHGLNYWNVGALVFAIPDLEELNIGHSIIAQAVLVGMDKAVSRMKEIISRTHSKI
ncbi:MAG: pyridoxine 5'-phosphate synthase [Candidatus Omnitrophota bacterium]|nr:MAG: pyridoxine 5'-phosphate synthase [Candidatus Omnitrophota bacterium]